MSTLIVICTIVPYLLLGLYFFINQSNYIYFPNDDNFEDCPGFKDAEKINLNGTRAYFKNNSKSVVVFYHGNAGSACQRAFLAETFEDLGHSYLIVEYTGYSNDGKKPSEAALLKNVDDIEWFLDAKLFTEVFIIGESLGTALASYNASLNDTYKLLLISPFYKLADVAQISMPIYPCSWILKDKYDNSTYIDKLSNATIIHGEDDKIIPIALSMRYFNNIKTFNKRHISIPDAGHNNLYTNPIAQNLIKEFLYKID